MFSWRPIHEETARKLLTYETRQGELITLLEQMAAHGMSVIPINDHPTEDTDGPLKSIDPFTFFAVFNRSLTVQNRRKNWQFLKDAWDLNAPVPEDFNGIPTLSPQNTWFFGWEHRRDPQDIPNLWKLARAVVEEGWVSCDPKLFEKCLSIHSIGVAKLTTGLFWIAPTEVLPIPATTVQYLKANGIEVDVTSKASYDAIMQQVRSKLSGDFIVESHKAWLHCLSAENLTFDFNENVKEGIWNAFRASYPKFIDFRSPGEDFQKREIDYKRAGLSKFEKLGGRNEVAKRLAANDPTGALEIITKTVALNIASFQSWRPSIGSDQPAVLADVLKAFVTATENGYSGQGTLLPIFDALERNNLKPAWDTLSVILWALRPTDYFPIKISYYRELAEKLGSPLPPGRPDVQKFHQVMRFGQAFWRIAEPKHPSDWVDVQSFLWGVCQNYKVHEHSRVEQTTAKNIWLIAPGERARLWERFQKDGVIGIGWDYLGDLKDYVSKIEIEEAIRQHEKTERRPSNDAHACWEFANVVKEGDFIIAKNGRTKVVGIGRVLSGYIHDPEREEYQHLRRVEWLRKGSWDIEDNLPMKTLTNVTPYPDFVRRVRPTANGSYVLRNGIFYSFCERAREDSRKHVFIIDEINRGNLSKILGELMMLIEQDKRSERYALPLAYADVGTPGFYVPPNVYILGLMNTADRSLAMVDYALRRRFAFVSLKPEFQSPKFKQHLLAGGLDEALADRLIAGLQNLNESIKKDRLDLGEGFCIGHSYFCAHSEGLDRKWINDVLDFEIRPLLLEYWMESSERADKAIADIKAALA